MNVRLPHGKDAVLVDIPDNWVNGRLYRAKAVDPCADPRAELMAALSSMTGCASISEMTEGKNTAVIAVDPSEPELLTELLPALIEIIEDESDIHSEGITILVANRLWKAWTEEQVNALFDEHIRSSYKIVLHEPRKKDQLSNLGTSSKGIPITVNSLYADAPFKVILGNVRAELTMGYTGGRAVLCPGFSGMATLRAMYQPAIIGHDSVRFGNFRDNPLHVHAMETAQKVGCDLCVSTTVNQDGRIVRVFSGHFGQSHFQAMNAARDMMQIALKEPMDIVITSGGGDPFDRSLLDVVDTLSAVSSALKPGGTIVLAADLSEGTGPEDFDRFFRHARNYEALTYLLGQNQEIIPGQWVAQILLKVLHNHEVIVFSKGGLAEEKLWAMGLTPVTDMNDAIMGAMESHGQRCKIVALPDGKLCMALAPAQATTSRVG